MCISHKIETLQYLAILLILLLSNQKQPSCKKVCSPQEGHCEKRSEIQGGTQEMA